MYYVLVSAVPDYRLSPLFALTRVMFGARGIAAFRFTDDVLLCRALRSAVRAASYETTVRRLARYTPRWISPLRSGPPTLHDTTVFLLGALPLRPLPWSRRDGRVRKVRYAVFGPDLMPVERVSVLPPLLLSAEGNFRETLAALSLGDL